MANGPYKKRKLTDIFWLILFVLFLIGFFVILIANSKKANPNMIMPTFDSSGRVCGVDASVKDYPYLYYTNK